MKTEKTQISPKMQTNTTKVTQTPPLGYIQSNQDKFKTFGANYKG